MSQAKSINQRLRDVIDELASSGKYVTYLEILEAYHGNKITDKLSTVDGYCNLKTLVQRFASEGLIQKCAKGSFRYVEGKEHHFFRKAEAERITRMNESEKLLYVTRGLEMVLGKEYSTNTPPICDFEYIPNLHNLEYVRKICKHIGKRVISFDYKPSYDVSSAKVVLHPYLLKEYNSRWFLLGKIIRGGDEQTDSKVIDKDIFAIDRIVSEPWVHPEIEFVPAPTDFYHNRFKDIVGVTLNKGETREITIVTTTYKVHNLIRTKPIHPSQEMAEDFDVKSGKGRFTLNVIPNIELKTKLLAYGESVYVVGDDEFRKEMEHTIKNMAKHYECFE